MENHSFIYVIFILLLSILITGHKDQTSGELIGGYIDGDNLITLHFTRPVTELPSPSAIKIIDTEQNPVEIQIVKVGSAPKQIELKITHPLDLKKEYIIEMGIHRTRLIMDGIYHLPAHYNAEIELGAIVSASQTTFRLFAPRASAITLLIYDNPTPIQNEKLEKHKLTEQSGGIWELVIPQNLTGKYYTYRIKSVAADCHPALEVVDPYAKIVTRGDGQSLVRMSEYYQTIGRGMIVDLIQTGEVESIDDPDFRIADAMIYETHVRDFTRDPNSGVPKNKRGLFIGAAQTGTRYKNFTTCLDHVTELGVNVVQLQPLNEFWVMDENSYKHKYIDYQDEAGNWHAKEFYNWGYAPINYFSVEGWFATNPDDLSRIREFKELVSAFHRQGIRVTVDVVFNHTFEGSRDNFAHWLFRGIDTDHYYRSFPSGQFCDGIYCGNELNTEHPMVAKYIIDCLKYWVTEFKIDGFRFDWMSAIDPKTLNRIVQILRQLNPELLIYGELWTLRGRSYQASNDETYVDRQHVGLFEQDYDLPAGSIAGFNDYFRDAVKGSGFQRDYSGGYIQNVLTEKYYNYTKLHELVKMGIRGMVDFIPQSPDPTEWQQIRAPQNSINYIACHDGFTLYDKLIIAAYCEYQAPGPVNSPKPAMPHSFLNPRVVDFHDTTQFTSKHIEAELKKMDKLGTAILFTSQGIPFMHSGQEFLRQKIKMVPSDTSESGRRYEFDSNSNTSPDAVNAIQWALKEKNYDIFQYYRGLIHLRKNHPTFRRTSAESVREGLIYQDDWLPTASEACIAYQLLDPENKLTGETWENVVVLINPYPERKVFQIPAGKWHVVVNGEKAGTTSIAEKEASEIEVDAISMMVAYLGF